MVATKSGLFDDDGDTKGMSMVAPTPVQLRLSPIVIHEMGNTYFKAADVLSLTRYSPQAFPLPSDELGLANLKVLDLQSELAHLSVTTQHQLATQEL
eukprot:302809-Karenia_brevis.AAC.1